jgi:hypothetical protein
MIAPSEDRTRGTSGCPRRSRWRPAGAGDYGRACRPRRQGTVRDSGDPAQVSRSPTSAATRPAPGADNQGSSAGAPPVPPLPHLSGKVTEIPGGEVAETESGKEVRFRNAQSGDPKEEAKFRSDLTGVLTGREDMGDALARNVLGRLQRARDELEKAIQNLKSNQSFEVLVFQDAGFSAFARDLVRATPDNRLRARDFIGKQTPKGEGYPFSALTAAMRLNPDAIWLISDGDLGDVKSTLHEVLRIHAGSRVRINTAAFLGDVPDRGPAWLMRSIAQQTGGRAINEKGEDLPDVPPPPPPPVRERPAGPSIFRER